MGTNAQQFCLKWNNHQANMLSVFDRLLSNKSLVDVTIGCEGRQVKAHKVVLSACSPFFENLFTENPCKHPIVILKDIRYADLKALVEFMYKGEVNVVQEQLPTLLKTAEALKIKGLAEVTGDGKADDKPNASVTPRPESPGPTRKKRQRVRRKSDDSAAHSDSEESMPKASRTEHDDSSMDGATSLDDGSQASLQPQSQQKEPSSNVQNNAVTVNNSSSSAPPNNANSTSNGPNSSAKDTDFEPTRLLEASMTTDHGADNSTELPSTGPDNTLIPDGLDIKPIITLEEGGATPAGSIVPASNAPSLSTGTDAISSLFPQGTGATALPGTSYQASPQSHEAINLFLKGFSSMQKLNIDFLQQAALIRNISNPPQERESLERVPSPGPSSPQNLSMISSPMGRVNVYHCPECTYTSNNRANVQRHVNTRHQVPEKLWPCRYCAYRTHRKDHLKSHEKRHEKNMDLISDSSITQVIEFD